MLYPELKESKLLIFRAFLEISEVVGGRERRTRAAGWLYVALSGVVSANRYGVSRVDVSSRWGLGCGDVRRSRRRRRRVAATGMAKRRGWKGRNERP